MDIVSPTVINLIIFVLAIYVGYHVGVDRHARAAHATDGRDQRHLGDRHRGRHAGRRAHRDRPGQDHGRAGRRAGGGQRLRRLPGHRGACWRCSRRRSARPRPQPPRELQMSMNLVTLLYLLASICFIQALKGLSHPTTSIRGNVFGMTGMAIAVLHHRRADLQARQRQPRWAWPTCWSRPGRGRRRSGPTWPSKVEMTKMPELVAFMHSMIGPGGRVHRGGRRGRAACLQTSRSRATADPRGQPARAVPGRVPSAPSPSAAR